MPAVDFTDSKIFNWIIGTGHIWFPDFACVWVILIELFRFLDLYAAAGAFGFSSSDWWMQHLQIASAFHPYFWCHLNECLSWFCWEVIGVERCQTLPWYCSSFHMMWWSWCHHSNFKECWKTFVLNWRKEMSDLWHCFVQEAPNKYDWRDLKKKEEIKLPKPVCWLNKLAQSDFSSTLTS